MSEKNKNQTAFTFSEKQIKEIRLHSDPTKLDNLTNERMVIAVVRLPSKTFRDFQFGKDSHGIDLDNREATINVPASAISLNLKNIHTNEKVSASEAKHVMLGMNGALLDKATKEDVSDKYAVRNCYLYADHSREYTVSFKGAVKEKTTLENGDVVKTYDRPDKVKIKGDVLGKMYNDCREKKQTKAKEKQKESLKSKKTKEISK